MFFCVTYISPVGKQTGNCFIMVCNVIAKAA